MSGFLRQARDSALRNARRWRREYPPGWVEPRRPRPLFLPGTGCFGLIAEVKRRSPSRGEVMPFGRSGGELAALYQRAGAEAVSVVVEEEHFGGSPALFAEVAVATSLPLLWKDFVVDPFQVELASAFGASGILLMASLLDDQALREMLSAAREGGLRPLVEVHDQSEAERALAAGADLVGVNHRDLRTLAIDLSLSERLASRLQGVSAVAESGLQGPADAARMRSLGYRAILVGTALASAENPATAARALLGEGA